MKLSAHDATVNGTAYPLSIEYGIDESAIEKSVSTATPAAASAAVAAPVPSGAGTTVKAPMPGLILRVNVKTGDMVKKNQCVIVMEAMKMENEIYSPCDGTVTKISVAQGQQMQSGDALITIA